MLMYQILHVYISYLSETLGVVCTFAYSEYIYLYKYAVYHLLWVMYCFHFLLKIMNGALLICLINVNFWFSSGNIWMEIRIQLMNKTSI